MSAAVKRLEGSLNTVKTAVGATKTDVGTIKEDLSDLTEDVGTIKEDLGTTKGAVTTIANNSTKVVTVVTETKEKGHKDAEELGVQGFNNTALTLGAFAVLGIILLLAIRSVGQKVDAVPAKTATKVNAFDAEPIDIDLPGKKVIFHNSPDATARKVYQILLVDADVDSTVTPETFHLEERKSRNAAHESLRRTMKEHFSGKLARLAAGGDTAAKLTEALIEHLGPNGDNHQLEIIDVATV